MDKNKISFITGIQKISLGRIILDKEYSKNFKLLDGSEISLSSTIGLDREYQQDSIAVALNDNYKMMLVADGMGGMYNGEEASYYTAQAIKKFFLNEEKKYLRILDIVLLEEVIYLLIDEITRRINSESGTTLSLAIVIDDRTYIVNIGDSRIYSIKNGILRLETFDDSEGFFRYKPKNSYDRDKLRFYRYNNIVTNSIIRDAPINLKIMEIENNSYDSLCLMTDGVSDILREEEIRNLLLTDDSAYKMTELSKYHEVDMVKVSDADMYKNFDFLSRIRPGKDNASVVVYKKKLVR